LARPRFREGERLGRDRGARRWIGDGEAREESDEKRTSCHDASVRSEGAQNAALRQETHRRDRPDFARR
jgi:hypothetical protein